MEVRQIDSMQLEDNSSSKHDNGHENGL